MKKMIIGSLIFSASILMAISQTNSFDPSRSKADDACPKDTEKSYIFSYDMNHKKIIATPKEDSLYSKIVSISKKVPNRETASNIHHGLITIKKIVPGHFVIDSYTRHLGLDQNHDVNTCYNFTPGSQDFKDCVIDKLSNDINLKKRLQENMKFLIDIVLKAGIPYFALNHDEDENDYDALFDSLKEIQLTISTAGFFKCPKEINVRIVNYFTNVNKNAIRIENDSGASQKERCNAAKIQYRDVKNELNDLNEQNDIELRWMNNFSTLDFSVLSNATLNLKNYSKRVTLNRAHVMLSLEKIAEIVKEINDTYDKETGINDFIIKYIFPKWKDLLQISDMVNQLKSVDDYTRGSLIVQYFSIGYSFDEKNVINITDLLDELIVLQDALNKKSTSNGFEELNRTIKTLREGTSELQRNGIVSKAITQNMPVVGPIFLMLHHMNDDTDKKTVAQAAKIEKVKKQITKFFTNYYFFEKNRKRINYMKTNFSENFCTIIHCNEDIDFNCDHIASAYQQFTKYFDGFRDIKDTILKNIDEKIEYNQRSEEQLKKIKGTLSGLKADSLKPSDSKIILDTIVNFADYLNIPIFDNLNEFLAQPLYHAVSQVLENELGVTIAEFYDGERDRIDSFSHGIQNDISTLSNRIDSVEKFDEYYNKYNESFKDIGKIKFENNFPTNENAPQSGNQVEGNPFADETTDGKMKNPFLRDSNGDPIMEGRVYKLFAARQIKWSKFKKSTDTYGPYGKFSSKIADFVRLTMWRQNDCFDEMPTYLLAETRRVCTRKQNDHYYFKINKLIDSTNKSPKIRVNDQVWIEAYGENLFRQNANYARNILALRNTDEELDKVVLNWGSEQRDEEFKKINFIQVKGSNEVYIGQVKDLVKNTLSNYIKMNYNYGELTNNKNNATKFRFEPTNDLYNGGRMSIEKIYRDELTDEELEYTNKQPLKDVAGRELKYGVIYYMLKYFKKSRTKGKDHFIYNQVVFADNSVTGLTQDFYPNRFGPTVRYSIRCDEAEIVGKNISNDKRCKYISYTINNSEFILSDKIPKKVFFMILRANKSLTQHHGDFDQPVRDGDRIWIRASGHVPYYNSQYFRNRLAIRPNSDPRILMDWGPWSRGDGNKQELFPDKKDDETIAGYMPTLIINNNNNNIRNNIVLKSWYHRDDNSSKNKYEVTFVPKSDFY